MKIYNTIVVYDVYVVAESFEEARAAAMSLIESPPDDDSKLRPMEQNALEVREARNIRSTWVEQKPLVAADVSDEDFEKLKGKNTQQVFDMLHLKQPAK